MISDLRTKKNRLADVIVRELATEAIFLIVGKKFKILRFPLRVHKLWFMINNMNGNATKRDGEKGGLKWPLEKGNRPNPAKQPTSDEPFFSTVATTKRTLYPQKPGMGI